MGEEKEVKSFEVKENAVVEEPAFTLYYSDYNTYEERKVSWRELQDAMVWSTFTVDRNSNCGRDVTEEEAIIVYKDEDGCAVLFKQWNTTDDPNPKCLGTKSFLRWYQYCNR